MGRHFGIFLKPAGGIPKPFLPKRNINPHQVAPGNYRSTQFRSHPIEHLEFIKMRGNLVLINQPAGLVNQIFVVGGNPYIDPVPEHKLKQHQIIVPYLLAPLVGYRLRFDINTLAQPEIEGRSGSVHFQQGLQVRKCPSHVSLHHQTHTPGKFGFQPAVNSISMSTHCECFHVDPDKMSSAALSTTSRR